MMGVPGRGGARTEVIVVEAAGSGGGVLFTVIGSHGVAVIVVVVVVVVLAMSFFLLFLSTACGSPAPALPIPWSEASRSENSYRVRELTGGPMWYVFVVNGGGRVL